MALELYGHPFSSYYQKALIAFYENAVAFTPRMLGPNEPATYAEFARLWPIAKMPLLVDDGRVVAESSVIIEYLDVHHPGATRLVPADAETALEVRFLDRFFDNYIQTPFQTVVGDALRDTSERDPKGVKDARARLEVAYAWLEAHMAQREWASERFSLADCAAAPALFYTDWVHEIAPRFKNVRAYRDRLNARPSFARCIDEARQYRPLFPLGAPDRD